ncbi:MULTISPECIES: acyltransferase [Aeromonas]|uniref:dTDP-D-Fuc3N acetylase n=1 Tax=Aeromonas hydrophila TaxID=644 RepID=A0A346ACF3_AERHY|nr:MULTISPECIES: acyltransferase [Aeromonas]AXL04915.1 dTDP-D-Fuc3N acetylase [Aeromonas hydrophila]MBQ4680462.1 N-acetyltransferase [Aeromonas dhakensis]MDX7780089.1 N-acetyltransferase [Aeromonas hydrophila]UNU28965.1 N-acetyltransferase [Aeromonas hydrophila]WAF78340.1 N-acetyltransferase [Aeromonas dhakensis]
MIHPTSIVSDKAVIGKNVSIGAYTIIYDNVSIEDDTIIEAFCEIGVSNSLSGGERLHIGRKSHIRSHSVFYEGSVFGASLVTGHRVTVREKTIAGKNLQIGTLSDIQGHCQIGDYVRTHSNVHIGQHSKIGNFVWIFPYVVLTNDPHPPSNVMQGVTVSDYAVIATMSVILPGAYIAEGCLIGAHSSLSGITEADTIYAGAPAKAVGATSKLKLKDGSRKPAYPWRAHFTRGYPEDVVQQWVKEFSQDV